MQPYQQASEEIIKQTKGPGNVLKKGAALGTAFVGGGALLSRLSPLLSNLIPSSLAVKGISKVSPTLGKFIQGAVNNGSTVEGALDFIKEKMPESKAKPDQKNPIQQHSDELHAFLDNEIKKGRQPLEAGALAQLQPKFKKVIKKLEEDHKTPFSSILQSIYGEGEQQSKAALQPQPEQAQSMQQGQPQPGQQGNGDQDLIAAFQKILQM